MIIYNSRLAFFIYFVSFGCVADSGWDAKEAHMQCGPALVKITAECKVDPEITTANICKNYKMEIIGATDKKSYSLPYMPDSQRKRLEEQGYKFNNKVKPGEWAPSVMKCYDSKNIVIGYQLGLSEEESVDGSLLSYVDAPFFDLSGRFIKGSELSNLRSREAKDPYNNTNIDFISNR